MIKKISASLLPGKTILCFIITFIFSTYTKSQSLLPDPQQFNWQDFELRGQVKSAVLKNFQVVESEEEEVSLIPYTYNDWDNALVKFNQQGWLTGYESYYYDTLGGIFNTLITKYTIDKKGNTLLWEEFNTYDSTSWNMMYEVDKKGLLLKETYNNREGKRKHTIIYKNQKGKYISRSKYDADHLLKEVNQFLYTENPYTVIMDIYFTVRQMKNTDQKEKYKNSKNPDSLVFLQRKSETYNSHNLLVKFSYHIGKTDSIHYYEINEYNEKKQLIQSRDYTFNNTTKSFQLTFEHTYEYNEYGDCIKSIQQSFTEDGPYITTYNYLYDEKGNWIRKTHLNNGNPELIQEREITYY